MKYLILSMYLGAWAHELSARVDPVLKDLDKKLVSVIKEIEVEKLVGKSTEFKKCFDQNKLVAGENQDSEKVAKATKCFQDELAKKDAAQLAKLSTDLSLESYGLVKSKSAKEVTALLTRKMKMALTGIDPDQESTMKFSDLKKKRQMVDQKVFIDLYTTQLGKNALFEISRFCFENFRKKGVSVDGKTFTAYWPEFFPVGGGNPGAPVGEPDDTGKIDDFGSPLNLSDKETIFRSIYDTIATDKTQINSQGLTNFYNHCSQSIKRLCTDYQDKKSTTTGAQACLTEARLVEIRKGLINSQKVAKEFEELSKNNTTIEFAAVEKFFDPKSNENVSLDNLTNASSTSFVLDKQNNFKKDSDAESCALHPEDSKCAGFYANESNLDKALGSAAMDMNLQKEVALARVRELKKGDSKPLKEYLDEHGYFDLANRIDSISKEELEAEIAKSFEAKKEATLAALNSNLGTRQQRDNEAQATTSNTPAKPEDEEIVKEKRKTSAEQSQDDRVRMAQVVMFNNIITSHLSLSKQNQDGTKEDIGRNVNAWLKESKGLESAGVIDRELFEQLQTKPGDAPSGSTQDVSKFDHLRYIENILGKPEGSN